jgi:hypothetical protein
MTTTRWILRKATCHSAGQDLHFVDDCPQDHPCPVWSLSSDLVRSRLYPPQHKESPMARNSHSISNSEVGLNVPPFQASDLLVPTLHNILGNLTTEDFVNVIEALLETRADQRFESSPEWTAYTFVLDDGQHRNFTIDRDNTV